MPESPQRTWLDRWALPIGLGVFLAPVLILLAGIVVQDVQEVALRKELEASGARIAGVVTARSTDVSSSSRDSSVTDRDFYLDYRFTPPGGGAPQTEERVRVSAGFYREHPRGSEIDIAYDPDDPSRHALAATLGSVDTDSAGFFVLGLAFVGGIAGARFGRRLETGARGPGLGWLGTLAMTLGAAAGAGIGFGLIELLTSIVF